MFCSALDGWGFGLGDFARLWAKRVGCKPRELRRMLWGSFVLNAKTKKVTKKTEDKEVEKEVLYFVRGQARRKGAGEEEGGGLLMVAHGSSNWPMISRTGTERCNGVSTVRRFRLCVSQG